MIELRTDFAVIGSGIAGLFTALKASALGDVVLLTKARLQESNTRYAQGGIAAAVGPDDSPRDHLIDTLKAGGELSVSEAVELLVHEGPDRIRELIEMGARFDTHPDGGLALAQEGAHSRRRILHAGGDATGAELAQVLCRRVEAQPRIRTVEHAFAVDLVMQGGRCRGVIALENDHRPLLIEARAVVLATGGCGQLYRYTTNPWVTTGDGLAMAWRAGARLVDMEFVQFHPTAFQADENPMILVSEAVRGEGARLVDGSGRAFMADLHPQGDLAPRDVVAQAIYSIMRSGGQVYLDARGIGERFRERFPNIHRACASRGVRPESDYIPIAPAAHFIMGGVQTDTAGATSIPGLYACGEVACTGVHGANRLASNSLLEGVVFAGRVAARLADEPAVSSHPPLPPQAEPRPHERFQESRRALQDLMWENVGITRTARGLQAALDALETLEGGAPAHAYELKNMAQVGRLIARSALERKESRGCHLRSDAPDEDPAWRSMRVAIEGERFFRQETVPPGTETPAPGGGQPSDRMDRS